METTQDALKKLDKKQCLILNAPSIDCLMCGIADARISTTGCIKLTYTDGVTHEAKASKAILETPVVDHSLFAWVSWVQEALKKEKIVPFDLNQKGRNDGTSDINSK